MRIGGAVSQLPDEAGPTTYGGMEADCFQFVPGGEKFFPP